MLRCLQNRGDLEDLLNVPAVDRLRSKRPPNSAALAQHRRYELEPAWQQLRAGHNNAAMTAELREERHIVVVDDDIMPLVAGEMPLGTLAKQSEPLDVVAVTWCNERNASYHRFPF